MQWNDDIAFAQTESTVESRALTARLPVRLHMAIIVAASLGTAVLTSTVLHSLGIELFASRWPFSMLAAYTSFFLGIGVWIRLFVRQVPRIKLDEKTQPVCRGTELSTQQETSFSIADRDIVDPFGAEPKSRGSAVLEVEEVDVPPHSCDDWVVRSQCKGHPAPHADPVWDSSQNAAAALLFIVSSVIGMGFDPIRDEVRDFNVNCLAAVPAILMLLGVVFTDTASSIAALWDAKSFFAEAAYQKLMVRTLGRRSGAPGVSSWEIVVFRATYGAAATVYAFFVATGFLLDSLFPSASTLPELFTRI